MISATRGTTRTSRFRRRSSSPTFSATDRPVGVHTIIWCDSVNNMNRTLDRQGMKEFENRILFQMSANDSSTLIDNPAASKLGENRALYYSEEANRVEKFRPYGIPELDWLEDVKKRFDVTPAPATQRSARRDRQRIGCAA